MSKTQQHGWIATKGMRFTSRGFIPRIIPTQVVEAPGFEGEILTSIHRDYFGRPVRYKRNGITVYRTRRQAVLAMRNNYRTEAIR